MTSANVFNVSSVGQNQKLNANAAASKTKAGNSGAASVFSSMMNVNYSTNANNPNANTSVKTDETDRAQNSYTQYSYQDHQIASATMTDKISDAADKLEDFDQKVVAKVAEELGVEEDDVRSVMEELGLTAFGLMDPQNLAQLTVQLTDVSSPEELLLQPQFVTLMQDMNGMQEQLLDELGLMPEELQELMSQMEVLDASQPMDATDFAGVLEQAADAATEHTTVENSQEVVADELSSDPNVDEEMPTESAVAADAAFVENEQGDAGSKNADDFLNREQNEVHTADRTDTHVAEQAPETVFTMDQITESTMSEVEDTSYLSVDTMDLIEQFAENVRVSVSEETSSMEMQLNPENLGKVYLQVSSEQGTVRAQIAASEEAVKNALQTQVAELRETLEQAGIKVDSIEVTVASHEFERNLEQGQSREFEEGQRQQEQQSQRRNINLSALDELSSMMTEEEALVAQMMKDNGNSVDLTA